MLSTPPTNARVSVEAVNHPRCFDFAPIMLLEHAMTVENAGMVGATPASSTLPAQMLLHVRLGTTVPQTAKSGVAPRSVSIICRTTGTERLTRRMCQGGRRPSRKVFAGRRANHISVAVALLMEGPYSLRCRHGQACQRFCPRTSTRAAGVAPISALHEPLHVTKHE